VILRTESSLIRTGQWLTAINQSGRVTRYRTPTISRKSKVLSGYLISRGLSPVLDTPEQFAQDDPGKAALGRDVVIASGPYPNAKSRGVISQCQAVGEGRPFEAKSCASDVRSRSALPSL
jgi:hypothetical protein